MKSTQFNWKFNLKSISVLSATVLVSVAAVAATFSLADVNAKIATLLAPMNNANTAVKMAFTSLNIDSTKTLDFGMNAELAKVGAENTLKIALKNLQYTYGDGTKPTVDLDAAVEFDFLKAFKQETLNELSKVLEKLATDFGKDYLKEYGPAATVTAQTSNKVVDANGDIEALTISLDVNIDLSQLPANKPAAEEEIVSFHATATVQRTGFEVTSSMVANPQYSGFQRDGEGLKEYIEKLLNDDAGTYETIGLALGTLNSLADTFVNRKPE